MAPWAFLTAPWPKYNQPSDIFLNVVGFLPLGFFFAAALHDRRRAGRVVMAALLAGAAGLMACALLDALRGRMGLGYFAQRPFR